MLNDLTSIHLNTIYKIIMTGAALKAYSHVQPFEPLFLSVTQITSEKTKTLQSVATPSRKTAGHLGAGYSQHRFGFKTG